MMDQDDHLVDKDEYENAHIVNGLSNLAGQQRRRKREKNAADIINGANKKEEKERKTKGCSHHHWAKQSDWPTRKKKNRRKKERKIEKGKKEQNRRKMLLTSSMGRTIWLANKKDIPVPRPFSTCNCQPLKNWICSFIIDHSDNKLQLSTFVTGFVHLLIY